MTTFNYSTLSVRPGVTIAYRRHPGHAGGLPGVIFLHGFRSDMTGIKAGYLEMQCAARDQNYVRFDCTGHGLSSGKFEDTCMGDWLTDALEVFDNLTRGPQIIVGSSMGGWLGLLLALKRPARVAGFLGLAPAPDFSEDVYNAFGAEERRHLEQTGLVYLPSDYGDAYPLTKKLFDDGRRHLVLNTRLPLACPIRLIHSRLDTAVPWQKSEKIKELATSRDVETIYLDDGDHRLSRPEDLQLIDDTLEEMNELFRKRAADN